MQSEQMNTSEEDIRNMVNDRVSAIQHKNINSLMPAYDKDVLAFDVVNPLQYTGLDAVKKRMEEWFSSFQGDIGFEIRELHITAATEIAFSHSLNHVSATKADGGKLDMFWRETAGYRKTNGNWVITHLHSSVPFDPETGKASLDLKPGI